MATPHFFDHSLFKKRRWVNGSVVFSSASMTAGKTDARCGRQSSVWVSFGTSDAPALPRPE
ncbi:MAG: hypothetical protein V2I76_15400, partial [Roseobacter sp.]|nr:hypothetical protein [Roseobacter sp.]